jgi:hypothetical protein
MKTKRITYIGRTQSLQQWCQELSLNYTRTYQRLFVCNWSVEQAFTLTEAHPKDKKITTRLRNGGTRGNQFTYAGETMSLRQWAHKLGVEYSTLYYRAEKLKLPMAQVMQSTPPRQKYGTKHVPKYPKSHNPDDPLCICRVCRRINMLKCIERFGPDWGNITIPVMENKLTADFAKTKGEHHARREENGAANGFQHGGHRS